MTHKNEKTTMFYTSISSQHDQNDSYLKQLSLEIGQLILNLKINVLYTLKSK